MQTLRIHVREPATAWHYFELTFLYSWLFWGLAILLGRDWTSVPTVLLYILGGVGPSLVAIVLIQRGATSETLSDFWRRTLDPRLIPLPWYLIILGISFGPNLVAKLAPVGAMHRSSADEQQLLGALLLVSVLAGFAEELGWRGYALDQLLRRHAALAASLIVGLGWTSWHLPLYFINGTIQQQAGLWSRDFWLDMTSRIPLALVFSGVYLATNRSILSAVLLHAVDDIASVLVAPDGAQLLVRLAVVSGLALFFAVRWHRAAEKSGVSTGSNRAAATGDRVKRSRASSRSLR